MENTFVSRISAAVSAVMISTLCLSPLQAETIGEWSVESASTVCSAGTSKDGASMILITSKGGASGILIKPASQDAISLGTSYKLQISFNGEGDHDLTSSAINFGGAKVLILEIPGAKIAAGEADGFSMRVKMNGMVLFEKDMHGARDAFAAFVACSKKFGA